MIGFLKGKIRHKNKNYILLEVQDVGYKVFVTTTLFAEANLGKILELFIYTNVKEDEIALYGFQKEKELSLFEKLISISGIGPRLALDILGSPFYIIQNALLKNDPQLLTEIKGIGKKTAERVILELKNKIDFGDLIEEGTKENVSLINQDVVSALEGLGYEKYQIIKKLQKLPADILFEEEQIKWFLQNA